MRPPVLGRPVLEVLIGAWLGARWRGAGVGEVGDGLDRGLQGGDGLGEGLQGRVQTLPGLALSFPDGTPPSAIDGVLRRYAGPSVSRFAFHTGHALASHSHVGDWLVALSRRCVESISIFNNKYGGGGGILTLHSSIFSCDRLVSLTLENCRLPPLPQPQPQPGGGFAGVFPVLKELYLTLVAFTEYHQGWRPWSQLQAMIRASPMLRVLLLEDMYIVNNCVIEAPNLDTLGIISSGIIHWRFGDLPRLQYASIDFGHRMTDQGAPAGCVEFLASVSQVQELIFKLPLWDFQMDAIPFTLPNLKSMELSIDFVDVHCISLMVCLLGSSPNLEKLKIEVRWANRDVNHDFLTAQWTDVMCANLQVVQILSYKGWLPLSLIKCILSKASLLRTLSVDACPVSHYNELLKCRRASPHAQVLFKVQLEKISFNRMKFAEKRLN
ncbi:hypothetical protein SORBI_3008G181900 [Sorghum bicolor]|uniref:F-box/LRR-repeat protein 15/At3g58940/PEG3-like LRR domain-containing protein n=2 Tax=Sorghum bicolor TaxID=4558 RepID=A0A1Z5R7Z3_SORBI|nr:hypothetical protein SORBI_3008G181900 [Sorghum bicolor]